MDFNIFYSTSIQNCLEFRQIKIQTFHFFLGGFMGYIFLFFKSVKEFMDFTCKIVAERTIVGSRASVKEQGLVKAHL